MVQRCRHIDKSTLRALSNLSAQATVRKLLLAMANLGSHASLLATNFASPFSCFLRSHRVLQRVMAPPVR